MSFGMKKPALRVIFVTLGVLLAFAANSLLARAALRQGSSGVRIDPYLFTGVRLFSGALMLQLLCRGTFRALPGRDRLPGALLLLGYALPFSVAYTALSTGTGAMLLFGAVQVGMLTQSFRLGERNSPAALLGFAGAIAGLVYLLLPGATAPRAAPALIMLIAGLCWAAYSLRGRGVKAPLKATSQDFTWAALLFSPVLAVRFLFSEVPLTLEGVGLAILSGALASGLGYAAWYRVLPHLRASTAAIVQLTVPMIATTGGVLLLKEPLTLRLGVSAVLILGGVFLALRSPPKKKEPERNSGHRG